MKLLLVEQVREQVIACTNFDQVPWRNLTFTRPQLVKCSKTQFISVFINEWHNEAINPKVQKISNDILGLSYADVGLVNMYPKLRKTKITFLFRNDFATENIFFPGYQSITHSLSYALCLYILWMQVAE